MPVAFIGGLTGQMYQQFALTIAISVLLSAFSALSLSPALSGMLLKPARPARGPLGVFFRGFNRVFDRATNGYVGVSRLLVRRAVLTILLVGVVVRRRRALRPRHPGRVHPRRGPGALRRQRAAAARRLARADERRAAPGRGDPRRRSRASIPIRRSAATASSPAPTSRTSAPSSSASSRGRSATARPAREGHHGRAAAGARARSRRRSPSRSTSRPSPASAPRPASTSCFRTAAAR